MPTYFTIVSGLNGLVLDIEGGNLSPGARVITWEENGQDNQLWYEDFACSVIRSKMSHDFVLDVMGDDLVINHYDPGSSSQRWCLMGDRICCPHDHNQVFDIANNDSSSGARLCTWSFNGGQNQSFSYNLQDYQYFMIRSALNGLVMDVEGGDSSPGAHVITWDENGQDNQLWYEDHRGVICSKLNNCVLDASDGDIVLNPFDAENSGQGFGIQGAVIANLRNPSQCIDIKGNDASPGTRMCQWEYKSSDNQHWEFNYV